MINQPDSAAVFACALSLHAACMELDRTDPGLNLSECYQGIDQFMREVMRVANLFEDWACAHVAFEKLSDVWPYLLEDRFGSACLVAVMPGFLMEFGTDDCFRVASCLRLPMWINGRLALPFLLDVVNPVSGSTFEHYRIQTVRNELDGDKVMPFVVGDEVEDENFGPLYFVIHGVGRDGALEHIAERRTYQEAADLLRAMFLDLDLPDNPVSG
jgi:hypothetical protein